ncbi:hypothetical protein MHBO_003886 [Bonamia ostreae]|uniref:Uncharacterized protein n=1 Tax=Bonamia ostreae TaxID=126728 RepID=A0ABV2ASC2_9EUKA
MPLLMDIGKLDSYSFALDPPKTTDRKMCEIRLIGVTAGVIVTKGSWTGGEVIVSSGVCSKSVCVLQQTERR